jgi:TP901 family phage tail tape measure protein
MDQSLVLKIAAKVAQGAMPAIAKLAGSVKSLSTRMDQVNQQASKVAAYRKLKREMKALKRQTGLGVEEAVKAKRAWRQKALALRKVSNELKRAGIDTKNLAARQAELAKKSRLATKQMQHLAKARAARNARQKAFGDVSGAVAPALMMAYPLKAAIDFESAMAQVKKTVKFESPDGLAKMSAQIKNMSLDIPISARGLADIAAAAGRLGVKEGDIKGFTETAARMSVAFDMTADRAGDEMADMANVFGMPVTQVERLLDAVNHLADNTSAKAPAMVDVLKRIGGSTKAFGLNATQAAALGNSFLALGVKSEEAGTAINQMLNKLGTADKQGAKFQAALAEVGFNAKELKSAIEKDAQGALVNLFSSLAEASKKDKGRVSGILMDLFGQEHLPKLQKLVGGFDKYREALNLTAKESNFLGSMQKEFEVQAATTKNQLQLLKNASTALAINFGTALLPYIKGTAVTLGGLAKGVNYLQQTFPQTTNLLSTLVGGMLTGIAIIKTTRMAFAFLKSGILEMKETIAAAYNGLKSLWIGTLRQKVATVALTVKQWAVTAATKAWAGAQWLATAAARVLSPSLIKQKVIAGALAVKQWAVTAATKAWAGAQWLATAAARVLSPSLIKQKVIAGALAVKQWAVIAATKAWAAAQWLINVALNANPIGLLISAVGLLAAGAYAVIKHWKKVKEWLGDFVAWIKDHTPDWLLKLIGAKSGKTEISIKNAAESMRNQNAASGRDRDFKGILGIEIKAPWGMAQVTNIAANGTAAMDLYAGEVDCW